jgi:hypothetical protein
VTLAKSHSGITRKGSSGRQESGIFERESRGVRTLCERLLKNRGVRAQFMAMGGSATCANMRSSLCVDRCCSQARDASHPLVLLSVIISWHFAHREFTEARRRGRKGPGLGTQLVGLYAWITSMIGHACSQVPDHFQLLRPPSAVLLDLSPQGVLQKEGVGGERDRDMGRSGW